MDWYYIDAREAKQVGPFSRDDLVGMISKGMLSSSDLVWHEGAADWQSISNFPELRNPPPPRLMVPASNRPLTPPPRQLVPAYTSVQTSGLAIASLCLGVSSVMLVWMPLISVLLGISAIFCGHMALSAIKTSNGMLQGRAWAILGLVLGYLWPAALLVIVLLIFLFLAGTGIL